MITQMKLVLYHFEGCPFCKIVRDTINRLGVPEVEYRDILDNSQYKEELIKMNGIRQVPCLVIDGKPSLESEEIVKFLEDHFGK